MDMGLLGFGEFVLLVSVVLINYFFASMWKILYDNWFEMTPIWKWCAEIKRLKLLASQADNPEIRKRCKFILNGIYFSVGFLILGCIVGALT